MPIQRPGKYMADELAKAALEDEPEPAAAPETEPKPAPEEATRKSPIERWRDAIEAAGITEEEADKVLDAVLAQGYYEKAYKVFRGRLTVVLRSRDSAALQRVSDALDAVRTNDLRVHTQTMNRYNLAASLVRYQDKVFKHPAPNADPVERERAFSDRLSFIDSIPAPVLLQLYAVLGKFDSIVFAALSEGAEMGF
jgi:hypothetical protein